MSRVYLLPISCFVLFQCTIISTYIASIVQNHVVPDVPYISDAATYSPESCIFGQLINTGCVLLALTIYARYRQIYYVMEHHEVLNSLIGSLNCKSLYIGLASCYGISIVANFQESNFKPMHYFGALTAFGMGTVYICFQSVISMWLEPFITLRKARYRMVLSGLCCFFFIVVLVGVLISHIEFEGSDQKHWYPSDGGWGWHVASSVSEWMVVTVFCFYILSFTDEFRYIKFDHPQISLIIVDDDQDIVLLDLMKNPAKSSSQIVA